MKKENEFTKVEKLVSRIPENKRNLIISLAFLIITVLGFGVIITHLGTRFLGSSLILSGYFLILIFTGILASVQREELMQRVDKMIADDATEKVNHFNKTGFKTPEEYAAYLKGVEDYKNGKV